ncbi:MAG: hypothetical protein OXU40_08675, partial [Nitrospira sp.]|nr:hypothetical protein [Nitrospira sp.]
SFLRKQESRAGCCASGVGQAGRGHEEQPGYRPSFLRKQESRTERPALGLRGLACWSQACTSPRRLPKPPAGPPGLS